MNKQEIIAQILSGEKAISSSALKKGKTSTRDFYQYYLEKKEKKSYFDFGNAFELYLIDVEEFKKQVVVMDETQRPEPSKDYKTKVNAEWKKTFYEQNENKYIIPATGKDSFQSILEMKALVQHHPMQDALYSGSYQQAFEWTCPITGLKRYARPDIFIPEQRTIIDIKTDAGDDFERAAANSDHFLQAWDQIQGAIHSGAVESIDNYFWAVFEKSEPYHITFYSFNLDATLPVETVYEGTLRRLKEDMESGQEVVWRDMPIKKLSCPAYYAKGFVIPDTQVKKIKRDTEWEI